jgi:hypothetical protein
MSIWFPLWCSFGPGGLVVSGPRSLSREITFLWFNDLGVAHLGGMRRGGDHFSCHQDTALFRLTAFVGGGRYAAASVVSPRSQVAEFNRAKLRLARVPHRNDFEGEM